MTGGSGLEILVSCGQDLQRGFQHVHLRSVRSSPAPGGWDRWSCPPWRILHTASASRLGSDGYLHRRGPCTAVRSSTVRLASSLRLSAPFGRFAPRAARLANTSCRDPHHNLRNVPTRARAVHQAIKGPRDVSRQPELPVAESFPRRSDHCRCASRSLVIA